MTMNLPHAAQTFLQEAADLLDGIEETALAMDPGNGQDAGDAVNQLFRAFHTIKGSGAMFGFDPIAAFTHHVETVLDQVRDGRLPLSEPLIKLILSSKDHIGSLLEAARRGDSVPADAGASLIAELNGLSSRSAPVS